MTPGLSKDIQCHTGPYAFLCLQINRSDIRPYVTWAVTLVIADDQLIFLRVCVGMYGLTYSLYHSEGNQNSLRMDRQTG